MDILRENQNNYLSLVFSKNSIFTGPINAFLIHANANDDLYNSFVDYSKADSVLGATGASDSFTKLERKLTL